MFGHLVAVCGLLAADVPDADLRAASSADEGDDVKALLAAEFPEDFQQAKGAELRQLLERGKRQSLFQRRAQPSLLEEEGRQLQDSLQGKGNDQTIEVPLNWHYFKCHSKDDCYNGGTANAHSYPNCNCGKVEEVTNSHNHTCGGASSVDDGLKKLDGRAPTDGSGRVPSEKVYKMNCGEKGNGAETDWPCQSEACHCHFIASFNEADDPVDPATNEKVPYGICGYWKAHGPLPKAFRNTFGNMLGEKSGDGAFGGPPNVPGDPEGKTFADMTTDLLYATADAMDKTDHDFQEAANVLVSDVYENFHTSRPDLATGSHAVKIAINANSDYLQNFDPVSNTWTMVPMSRENAAKDEDVQRAQKLKYKDDKQGIHNQWEMTMLPAAIMLKGGGDEDPGAREGDWMCTEAKKCWQGVTPCRQRTGCDASRSWCCPECPEECLGAKFKLENHLVNLKKEFNDALDVQKEAFLTVRPNITYWQGEGSLLTKELLAVREDMAKLIKNWTDARRVDEDWNNPPNWGATTKEKFNPEIATVLADNEEVDEQIADQKKNWKDSMNQIMARRIESQQEVEEDSAEAFHLWLLQTKDQMDNFEKADTSALRTFEHQEGDLKRLAREQRKNMSKEDVEMRDLDRAMEMQFKKEQRKNDKLSAKLWKDAEKGIETTQQNDVDDVKDFERQSEYQVGARTKQFDKLMKAVDKTKKRELAAMYKKLEELSGGALRVRARADQSRQSTALEGIAETITKANAAMAMTLSDTQKAENSADGLTKKKAENLKSSTVFRIDAIEHYITDAVQNMTDTIGEIVVGRMIPDEQKSQRMRVDAFDKDYSKYEREDRILDKRLESAKTRYDTMLTELKHLIGPEVGGSPNAQLPGLYAYLDTLVGIEPAGDRNKVEAGIGHQLQEVKNQLDDLIALANANKASLEAQGRDAIVDFTHGMTDTRTKAQSDVSNMNKLLGEKMDTIKAQFATHTTGEGGLDDKIATVQAGLKKAMVDIPAVTDQVAKDAELERTDALAEETKADDAVKQLGVDQIAAVAGKKQAFDQDLLETEHAILDGITSRKTAFEEDTIATAEAKIHKVYTNDYLPGRRERLEKVQKAAQGADDEQRKLAGLEDDFGPAITKLDLEAQRVGETTSNAESGYRHAAKLGYESAMKRLTSAPKPIIDAKYGEGKRETQTAADELGKMQDEFESHVAAETKKMQKGAEQSAHSTQPLAGALMQATTEFDAQVLGQTSTADGLSSLVSGAIDRLSTADLAARHASGQMDDALAAHKKAMLKKVDKLGGSLSLKEKAALEKQVEEMAEQMAAIGAEENGELSEEAKKKLADLSQGMEDVIGEKKSELQKAEFWQHHIQEETVKSAAEGAEEGSQLAGNVLAQTSKEETELNQQAKEEMNELSEEAGPAEQILYTLQQVQNSLNTLRDASEGNWREMKSDHQAHADDAFQTALNQFASIHQKHAEAVETAKEAGRRLDQTVLEIESDMTDDRRRLNSTSIQVSNRLDTEVGNLDADVKEINSATDTGARLVAELANKTAGGIGEVATDADERMEQREEESHAREEQLENAENLQVSAEESDIMALAGDAQAASARSTSLDAWFHRFGSMDLAFKTAVADKLKELGAEGADLDAQALRAASGARLGIVDMKSQMGKEAAAPLQDAKARLDAKLSDLYVNMDAEIQKLMQDETLSEAEREAKIKELRAKAKAEATRLQAEGARLRQQEVKLESEMSRYEAALDAKKALLHAKIESGLLSPKAQEVHDKYSETDAEVHRQSVKAEHAVENLQRRTAPTALLEQRAQQQLGQGIEALDSLNDALESEDAQLERQVQMLELRRHQQ